jgi:hypothetical protein
MKALNWILGAAVCLIAGAAAAQDLTWAQLASRPELWPAECTVKNRIDFQGGVSVAAGAKVQVIDFKGNEADMRTPDGRTYFAAEPDDTDVLDVARAAFAQLTPKQRALTYPGIAQQKDLWPYQLTITRGFSLAAGKDLPVGDKVLVKNILADRAEVVSEKLNARFNVTISATDLMAQARKFVEDDSAGPRLTRVQKEQQEKLLAEQKAEAERIKQIGRVPLELEGRLINAVSGQPEPLDTNALPKYIVFLRGSTTCSITRNFAPSFIKFYNDTRPAHPEYEVVYLTLDSIPDTEKFAQEMGFSWRMVSWEKTTMPSVSPIIDGRIPQLIVMKRDGTVLANGIQSTAPAALDQLAALLKQQPN